MEEFSPPTEHDQHRDLEVRERCGVLPHLLFLSRVLTSPLPYRWSQLSSRAAWFHHRPGAVLQVRVGTPARLFEFSLPRETTTLDTWHQVPFVEHVPHSDKLSATKRVGIAVWILSMLRDALHTADAKHEHEHKDDKSAASKRPAHPCDDHAWYLTKLLPQLVSALGLQQGAAVLDVLWNASDDRLLGLYRDLCVPDLGDRRWLATSPEDDEFGKNKKDLHVRRMGFVATVRYLTQVEDRDTRKKMERDLVGDSAIIGRGGLETMVLACWLLRDVLPRTSSSSSLLSSSGWAFPSRAACRQFEFGATMLYTAIDHMSKSETKKTTQDHQLSDDHVWTWSPAQGRAACLALETLLRVCDWEDDTLDILAQVSSRTRCGCLQHRQQQPYENDADPLSLPRFHTVLMLFCRLLCADAEFLFPMLFTLKATNEKHKKHKKKHNNGKDDHNETSERKSDAAVSVVLRVRPWLARLIQRARRTFAFHNVADAKQRRNDPEFLGDAILCSGLVGRALLATDTLRTVGLSLVPLLPRHAVNAAVLSLRGVVLDADWVDDLGLWLYPPKFDPADRADRALVECCLSALRWTLAVDSPETGCSAFSSANNGRADPRCIRSLFTNIWLLLLRLGRAVSPAAGAGDATAASAFTVDTCHSMVLQLIDILRVIGPQVRVVYTLLGSRDSMHGLMTQEAHCPELLEAFVGLKQHAIAKYRDPHRKKRGRDFADLVVSALDAPVVWVLAFQRAPRTVLPVASVLMLTRLSIDLAVASQGVVTAAPAAAAANTATTTPSAARDRDREHTYWPADSLAELCTLHASMPFSSSRSWRTQPDGLKETSRTPGSSQAPQQQKEEPIVLLTKLPAPMEAAVRLVVEHYFGWPPGTKRLRPGVQHASSPAIALQPLCSAPECKTRLSLKQQDQCGECDLVRYCSVDCQRADWDRPGGHKEICPRLQRRQTMLWLHQVFTELSLLNDRAVKLVLSFFVVDYGE